MGCIPEIALLFTDEARPTVLPRTFSQAFEIDLDEEFEAKLAALLDTTGATTVHCFQRRDRKSEDRIAGCLLPRDCEVVWHPLPSEKTKATGSRSSKTAPGRRRAH